MAPPAHPRGHRHLASPPEGRTEMPTHSALKAGCEHCVIEIKNVERVGVNRPLIGGSFQPCIRRLGLPIQSHQAPHRIRALGLLSRNRRRSGPWAPRSPDRPDNFSVHLTGNPSSVHLPPLDHPRTSRIRGGLPVLQNHLVEIGPFPLHRRLDLLVRRSCRHRRSGLHR